MALLSAIALTAAALIGYLIEEYQPPDAARVEIEKFAMDRNKK